MGNLESGSEGLFEINPAQVLQARPKHSLLLGKIFKEMSFGWWPVRFFFLLSGNWQCDWFAVTRVGSCSDPTPVTSWALWSQRDVCLLFPSRNSLTQPLMYISVSVPPLSFSFSMTILPNITSLSLSIFLFLSVSLSLQVPPPSLWPCIVEQTALTFLTVHSHIMVLPAASLTLWSHQCLCKSVCSFDVRIARTHCYFSPPLPPLPLPGMREHPPIPVIDLADHIERLKANDGLRFSQEYEVSCTH